MAEHDNDDAAPPVPESEPLTQLMLSISVNSQQIIEWAEGQRTMMITRGWSIDAAEQYALELLLSMTRIQFAGTKK